MPTVRSGRAGAGAEHRRLTAAIKQSLREVRSQLTLLNHRVGHHAKLRDVDLDCLDLISREGPLSPGQLAQRTGLHPATTTGVLDRLEHAGWVAREPHPSDRRATLVHARPRRARELIALYAGMNKATDGICRGYTTEQLALIADFLHQIGQAGRAAVQDLSEPAPADS